MESDDVLEHTLPLLDFDAADGPVLGGSEVIVSVMTSVDGGEEELGQEAPLSPALTVSSARATEPTTVVEPRGGGPGQVASTPSSPPAARVAEPPVAPATPSSQRVGAGGEYGQAAHGLPSPCAPAP